MNDKYIKLTNMNDEELLNILDYLKELDLKGEISDEDIEEIRFIENLLKINI